VSDFLASNIVELNFRFWQYFYVSICHVTFGGHCDFVIGMAPKNDLNPFKTNYLLHVMLIYSLMFRKTKRRLLKSPKTRRRKRMRRKM
jgi:hypothetical protein